MQYYIGYCLGIPQEPSPKADFGTVAHGILENIALYQKAKQEGKKSFESDILGKVNTTKEVPVKKWIDKCYNYFKARMAYHDWNEPVLFQTLNQTLLPYDFIELSVKKALEVNGGAFDPRNRVVFDAERHFDFPIEKEWARVKWEDNGVAYEDYLRLKGTVDLILFASNKNTGPNDMLEVFDYKTGSRKDWATDELKTIEYLQNDKQLRFYHYALSHVLGKRAENMLVSINFINDGGVFTVQFTPEDLPKTEEMLRQKFEEIKNTTIPILNESWKCKMCTYYKTSFGNAPIVNCVSCSGYGTTIKGYICKWCNGTGKAPMSKCRQIKSAIESFGIDSVQKNYKDPNHVIGRYQAPGGK